MITQKIARDGTSSQRVPAETRYCKTRGLHTDGLDHAVYAKRAPLPSRLGLVHVHTMQAATNQLPGAA